jgi:hypothetical protein
MHNKNKILALLPLLLFTLIFNFSASAQSGFTLSGYVKDKASGEDLIGASVVAVGTGKGISANSYGYYALTLPEGVYTIKVSYIGYKTIEEKITLKANTKIDFKLDADNVLNEVEVHGEAPRTQLDKTQMSKMDLNIEQVKKLPVLFGEVDVLKTLQLLPGVQSGSEGSTGFFVRGGAQDQNLIILDEATVYNASHLFGFFSVFNSDAIKNVELYKGDFPAKFGGRLSSVVDITLKDGNKEKFSGEGGIGLIASRLTLEGPIVKGKSSFIISGRRTYVDLFTNILNVRNQNNPNWRVIPGYYFYDLNAKVNYELSSSDRVFLSGYFGRDVFSFNRGNFGFGFNWGNATGTARWNHVYSPRLFQNTTATFTDYEYDISNTSNTIQFNLGSHIQDWSIKTDFDFIASEKHYIRFGASEVYHIFDISRFQLLTSDNTTSARLGNTLFGNELGIYVSDDWEISKKFKLNYGLRWSGFIAQDKIYQAPEPRIAARYKLTDDVSLKASYTHMNQYVHLVSNSGSTLPTDIWYPSNKNVAPMNCDQVAAGVTTLILGDKLTITDEVYYKQYQNLVDYKNGAQLFLNTQLDTNFVFGKGWSYGNEIFIQKQVGRFTGWIAYTLAWTQVQFKGNTTETTINNGNVFYAKYDQRHNISVVASYDITDRLTASATFVYQTGPNTTLATSYSMIQDVPRSNAYINLLEDTRNNVRLPSYNRLDLSIVWKFKPKWGKSDLTLSIYNVYDRLNPYIVYIDIPENKASSNILNVPAGATLQQISLFPIIPSLTYNFKF